MDLKRLGPYDILAPLGAGGFGEARSIGPSRLDVLMILTPPHACISPAHDRYR